MVQAQIERQVTPTWFGQVDTTIAVCTYGSALIRKDGETPLFDGLGSERTVTNGSGLVTASLTPSAFGRTIASTGSSTIAYQFAATSGYRTEGDAGLTLVGCRSYDAQVGRFITRDTDLDQKPYAYCDGDPINSVDPSGHFTTGQIVGTIFTAVLAIAIVAVVTCATGGADLPVIMIIAAGIWSGAISKSVGNGVQTSIDTHSPQQTGRSMIDGLGNGALSGGIAGVWKALI